MEWHVACGFLCVFHSWEPKCEPPIHECTYCQHIQMTSRHLNRNTSFNHRVVILERYRTKEYFLEVIFP